MLPRACPFGLGTQQIFLGDHLQNRADILRHAAVHEHQAVLKRLRAYRRKLPPHREFDAAASADRG